MLAPWKTDYDKPIQHIKKQRHCFANNNNICKWKTIEGKKRRVKKLA